MHVVGKFCLQFALLLFTIHGDTSLEADCSLHTFVEPLFSPKQIVEFTKAANYFKTMQLRRGIESR